MNKILVVESEIEFLELLAELLTLYNFCSITATSSEQGYELIKSEKPDLILCGHSSINLRGYENCWKFLQRIRQDVETANIPFIFMTGAELETIPNWQNYLTYQDILLKPFNSQLLLEKINTHLQSASPKSKTKKIQKLSGSKAYIYHNAFFTKENRATHNYSCFLA